MKKTERKIIDTKFRIAPIGTDLNTNEMLRQRLLEDYADGWDLFQVNSTFSITGDGAAGAGSFYTMFVLVKYAD